jgi:hypothetical protein
VEDSVVFVSRLQERENIENITIAILVHKRETTSLTSYLNQRLVHLNCNQYRLGIQYPFFAVSHT